MVEMVSMMFAGVFEPWGVACPDPPRGGRPPQDPERDRAPGVCAALHRGRGAV